MKQYEILWVPVDRDSSQKSTRIETACGTLDAVENSIVLTLEEAQELFIAGMKYCEALETSNYNGRPDFSQYLTSKGITL